jgi:hypothetical protein
MGAIEELLMKMLAYNPSERIGSALESGWMKRWGRLAIVEMGVIG